MDFGAQKLCGFFDRSLKRCEMGMGDIILDRISFGGVKELEEIYLD
jgi:hypothetical protein